LRPLNVWLGMALESVGFAFGLWALSKELGPFLEQFDIHLSVGMDSKTLGRVVTFVGAGIYEEMLFRLLLFCALGIVFRLMGVPRIISALLVGIASAVLFAAAHHLGPYGEPINGYVFLFRSLAGFYFALLYQLRGFGIAVGAHACYDVLVGVLIV
jgi:membrane protease YdiL (CAAX protease family)